jgi:hypothetical protein
MTQNRKNHSCHSIRKNNRDRQRLADYEGRSVELIAVFTSTGHITSGFLGQNDRTALLTKLRRKDDGIWICDHIWVRFSNIQNPEVLEGKREGEKIMLSGIPYRYYSEFGRRRQHITMKYGLDHITIRSQASP